MADWYFRNNQTGGPQQGGLVSCPGCRNLVKRSEEFCPYCARRLRPESGARAALKRLLTRPDVATKFLLGLLAAVFVLQFVVDFTLPDILRDRTPSGGLFSFGTANNVTYVLMGSNIHSLVQKYGEVWRFVTSCFLHFGILHIVFNGWVLWDLGRLVERLWGSRQTFAVFILAGIAGAAMSYFWNMTILGQPKNSAGASGAICGMLGILLGAYYRNRYQIGEHLGQALIRWAVYILVFGLVMGADNAAHIGGFLAGGLMGYFLRPTRFSKSVARDQKIWTAAAGLSLLFMLASFGFAVAFYIHNIHPAQFGR